VRSGHWELLEPGHGEVWQWLTVKNKDVALT